MSKQILIIFTRVPVPGQVKTRLIPAIGAFGACRLYEYLVQRLVDQVQKLPVAIQVWYASGPIPEQDIWYGIAAGRYVQFQDNDLGKRMYHALKQAFSDRATKVVLVGTDIPELTGAILDSAFSALNTVDVVIGPAKDGGYYLIGLNHMIPELFLEKEWSTDTVFSRSIADLEQMQKAYSLMPKLSDIDTVEDLQQFPELLKECGLHSDQAIQQENAESNEKTAHHEADT